MTIAPVFQKLKKQKIHHFLLGILILFLLVFPKGGIKIQNIPITWGYLLLGFISLALLFRKKIKVNKNHIYILLAFIPFQIISLLTIAINGFEVIGFTISFFVSFFILPFIFFFILSEYIEKIDLDFFIKFFKRGILFIAAYGIFLFFFRIFMGYFYEIPFLTINYHDSGLLDHTKCIERGEIFKLISTYNNGTLYGVCILIVLSFYNLVEKKTWKKSLVLLSLVLTISRTIWIGLIFNIFLNELFVKKYKKTSLLKFSFFFILSISIFLILPKLLGFNIFWLYDKNLGGRLDNFDFLSYLHIISFNSFWGMGEMIYLSILQNFGLMGFLSYLIAISSPLIIYFHKNYKKNISDLDKSLIIGLITYLFISISDGAILHIPTMLFFLFT
ncbi:MAG: hypothetical protein JXA94_01890, partial [Parachlamydiales bacterium]|nr:hypothetical protein [Parachlamydiales bacterium]